MYRAKSLPVKAVKFRLFETTPAWLARALECGKIIEGETSSASGMLDYIKFYIVETEVDYKKVSIGDWIVQYPDGSLDVFDDKEFHEKFEVVEGETEDGFQ